MTTPPAPPIPDFTLVLLDEKTEQQSRKTGNNQSKILKLRDSARSEGYRADVFITIEENSEWEELRKSVATITGADIRDAGE